MPVYTPPQPGRDRPEWVVAINRNAWSQSIVIGGRNQSVRPAVGRTISENTKTALAAAKARGVKLGNPNGARALKGKQIGNADAVAKIKTNAAQHASDLKGIVDDIRRSGITTVRGIANELHKRGIRAPRGDTWHPTAVARLLNRLSNSASV